MYRISPVLSENADCKVGATLPRVKASLDKVPDFLATLANGGFPAMVGNVAFLMKDVVLLAVSFYLLKQNALRIQADESIGSLTRAPGSPQAYLPSWEKKGSDRLYGCNVS